MVTRNDILDEVQRLALETGQLPSLQAAAQAVGLTKQGVLHHFPSRADLDRAVVLRALEQVDAAMITAASSGSPAETYLRLSSPTDHDRAAALVMAAAARNGARVDLPEEVAAAAQRWEQMMTQELGDPTLAEIVRLTGDGLFSEALVTGASPDPARVDRIVHRIRAASS